MYDGCDHVLSQFVSQQKVQSKQGKSEDEGGRSFRAGNVLIYDVNSLMPFSKDLGATYVWVMGRPEALFYMAVLQVESEKFQIPSVFQHEL